jgi:hypothetical protein
MGWSFTTHKDCCYGTKKNNLPRQLAISRLSKSLYGLKQAPRAWFLRFTSFVKTIGFSPTRSDASLFTLVHGANQAFLLLYVDDIILTASSPALLQRIIV